MKSEKIARSGSQRKGYEKGVTPIRNGRVTPVTGYTSVGFPEFPSKLSALVSEYNLMWGKEEVH